MKTKFILHGGMTNKDSPHNDTFFTEFSKTLDDDDNVLYVGFARETEEEQEEVYQRDKQQILSHTDKSLNVIKAELGNFTEQIKTVDAIYVTGGTSKILKDRLLTCPSFADSLIGKVYAGLSAGANILSMYHTSGSSSDLQEGLGILPICLMAHYGNPEFNATEERKSLFEKHTEKYELILLPEYEWVIKEIEL